jgi:ABC-type nitrate/sulfonate/bicarbonate transport system substrate-binding protein
VRRVAAAALTGSAVALALLAGCGRPSSAPEALPPRSEAEARAAVQRGFPLARHVTNEFIPVPGAAPLAPLVPLRKVRLGLYWVANDQWSPWYVGLEKGFFRDVGLDLEIVEGGPGREQMNALIAGRVDLNIGSSESVFRVLTSPTGADLVMIAANLKAPVLALIMLDATVPRDQPSTRRLTAADVRGHRLGLQPDGYYFAQMVADRMGFPVEDLTIVNAGATPDGLIGGAMDFYLGWLDNQPRILERNGYRNWNAVSFAQLGYQGYGDITMVTRATYERDPGMLRRYVAALDRSMRYLLAHRDEAAAITARAAASYQLTREEVRWRIDRDAPLFTGDGSEPLLAMGLDRMQANFVQLYRYRQVELPGAR